MSDELKPCPFCGGEAVYSNKGWGENMHIIHCTTKTYGCQLCPKIRTRIVDVSKEMMFEIWNTRHTPTPQGDAVETIQEVKGCFEAAYTEGFEKRLREEGNEILLDIYNRRLLYAYHLIETRLPALQQQTVDVPSLEEELAEETAQMWEQGKDYPKIDIAALIKKYISADHEDAKDPWLTENEIKAYNMAVHDLAKRGLLRTPLEKVDLKALGKAWVKEWNDRANPKLSHDDLDKFGAMLDWIAQNYTITKRGDDAHNS